MSTARFQRIGFVAALLALTALIAWLTQQHRLRFDTTAQARHTLSTASVNAVTSLDGELEIEAWLEAEPRTRAALEQLISRYRQHKPDISLRFIDPVTAPAKARELSIPPGGELLFNWQGRQQRLRSLSEKSFSYALMRLSRAESPRVRFVSGHLERSPDSTARHGYGQFAGHLRNVGVTVETISLITQPAVPADTDLLVIAAPAGDYFPGEAASVLNYLAGGGNLLWLLEPAQATIPAELAAELGISVLPGVIVDVAAQQLAVDTPDFAVIDRYPDHPALPDQLPVTLFPQASGLSFPATIGWEQQTLLATGDKSWTETGTIAGRIRFDENSGEQAGPIVLGATLTRKKHGREQRVAVIGDADFLGNSWLGNGGNLYLGQQLFDWLSGHSPAPAIAPIRARDAQITLSPSAMAGLGFGFLVFLPGIFILLAVLSWRKRRA